MCDCQIILVVLRWRAFSGWKVDYGHRKWSKWAEIDRIGKDIRDTHKRLIQLSYDRSTWLENRLILVMEIETFFEHLDPGDIM